MKAMKKVFAMLLALAMIVTAVPVADASAATYNMKAGSISKTLYAGRTHTLKLKGLAASKVKSTKWTVGKASVVKLSNTDKTKATMKLVGKGYTVVTAKVTLKTKKTKTYKAKITVKNPSLTIDTSEMELALGSSAVIKVTSFEPSGEGKAKLTYVSLDEAVATVSGGTVTATGLGETEIVTSVVCGTKKVSKKTKVKVVPAADGLTVRLTNPVAQDYVETVCVNQKAIINAQYVRGGKPIAGKTLVMTLDRGTDSAANYDSTLVATTDANGIATFIIANKKWDTIKASETGEVASIYYTISSPSDNVTSEQNRVSFAAISLAPVENTNVKYAGGPHDLTPGVNYQQYSTDDSAVKTSTMDTPWAYTDEYVMSQQVSTVGGDEHKVTFKGGYPIITLPSESYDLNTAKELVDPINFTSDKYGVYNDASNDKTTAVYELIEDANKLTMATLNLSHITLSANSRLVIETYTSKIKSEPWTNGAEYARANAKTEYVYGPCKDQSVGYQIPMVSEAKGVKSIKVYIESAGQVDLDNNDGFTLDSMRYIFKARSAGKDKTVVPLKNAKVTWSKTATYYTTEEFLKGEGTYTFGKEIIVVDKGGRLTMKLPVFPLQGTGILTNYDKNGDVKAYYAIDTTNGYKFYDTDQGYVGWWAEYRYKGNVNVPCDEDGLVHVYKISEEEATRDQVGNITDQDGTNLTVNSTESGRMSLKGEVSAEGFTLDAETSTVYTFVQWNPISDFASKNFVAFLGQDIEVYAQLVDQNGNNVTTRGVGITFSNDGEGISADDLELPIDEFVSIVDIQNKTDKNGRAKLVLKGSDKRVDGGMITATGITASCTNSSYRVKLVIAGKDAATADLWWTTPVLRFTPNVPVGVPSGTYTYCPTNYNIGKNPWEQITNVSSTVTLNPAAGSNWQYGVQTLAFVKNGTTYDVLVVSDTGIQMSKAVGGVGTVTDVSNGVVNASSKTAGEAPIVSKIDSKSDLSKAKVVKNEVADRPEYTFAGTGKTSVTAKLTLKVQWTANGIAAKFATPNGIRLFDAETPLTDNTELVYVAVTDKLGNPLTDTDVTFSVTSTSGMDYMTTAYGVTNGDGSVTVATDKYGIAVATLNHPTSRVAARSTVIAKVEGLNDKISQTYTWLKESEITGFSISKARDGETGRYVTCYDDETGIIQLVFTADIVETSLLNDKNMITATYDKKGNGDEDDITELVIKSVEVDNNVVSIAVNKIGLVDRRGLISVTIKNNYTPAGSSITYIMTSEDGARYRSAGQVTFTFSTDSLDGIKPGQDVDADGSGRIYDDAAEEALETLAAIDVAGLKTVSLPGEVETGSVATVNMTYVPSDPTIVDVQQVISTGAARGFYGEAANVTTGAAWTLICNYKGAEEKTAYVTVRSEVYSTKTVVTSGGAITIPTLEKEQIIRLTVKVKDGKFVSMSAEVVRTHAAFRSKETEVISKPVI